MGKSMFNTFKNYVARTTTANKLVSCKNKTSGKPKTKPKPKPKGRPGY